MLNKYLYRYFCFFILLTSLQYCASSEILRSNDPELIYNEAQNYIERGRYLDAQEFLNEIRRRFPQSRYATLAELRAADVEHRQKNYTAAAALYGTFVELYPNHHEAAYAQYMKAKSYLEDTPKNIARDQSPARDAAASAQQLLRRYPQSEYTGRAQEIYQDARMRLARKEASIARFYERRSQHEAAKRRWTGLIRDFNDLMNSGNEDYLKLRREAEKNIEQLNNKNG